MRNLPVCVNYISHFAIAIYPPPFDIEHDHQQRRRRSMTRQLFIETEQNLLLLYFPLCEFDRSLISPLSLTLPLNWKQNLLVFRSLLLALIQKHNHKLYARHSKREESHSSFENKFIIIYFAAPSESREIAWSADRSIRMIIPKNYLSVHVVAN